MQSIYLDNAAATPMDARVREAMEPYFSEQFYNPSATYGAALKVRKQLDTARAKVAHWLGARPSEVIFTAGGTEANNLFIHGVMQQYADANVVVSAIEHDSVLVPAAQYDCRQVAPGADGVVNPQDLAAYIDDNTVLVSIMQANNEVGTVQKIRDIGQVLVGIRRDRTQRLGTKAKPLYFHTDSCQAVNYLDLHVARLGVDFMTLNGGKIYGPKQSGVLYVRAGVPLKPLISGGGQEHNLRSGTENVAAAIGFSEALDLAQSIKQAEAERLQALQRSFFTQLEQAIPEVIINGSRKLRLPNNVHITIPGKDNERLLIQLDEAGVLAAAGSACSASNEEPSHVLRALGVSDELAQSSLRFTMGRGTTQNDVDRTVALLVKLLA